MKVMDLDREGSADPGLTIPVSPKPHGPVIGGLLRRAGILWALSFALGTGLAALDLSHGWNAFGLGVVLPGGGFLYASDVVFFVVTLLLFVVSLVAWFGMGNIVAPVAVWLGSAGLSTLRADTGPWTGTRVGIPVGVAAIALGGWLLSRRSWRAARRRGAVRNAYLARVDVEPGRTSPKVDELSPTDLAAGRFLLDRALQPVDAFDGFDVLDQFQTAAIRYQVYFAQWALATMQSAATPAFDGYLSEAQRRLIAKVQHKRIWNYWRHENLWGNLSLDPDPIPRDNIMLSGYYGAMLVAYEAVTGDARYREPESIRFRLDDRREYRYDVDSIAAAVRKNYEAAALGMFPCEPNWVYSSCNSAGMAFLKGHATVRGSDHFDATVDRFQHSVDHEFSTADGRVTAIRSSRLGLTIPSLTSLQADVGSAVFLNPTLPAHALRLWTIARTDLIRLADGELDLSLRGWDRLDVGNYRPGAVTPYCFLAIAARELGDEEVHAAAMEHMERNFDPATEAGVRTLRAVSTQANVFAAWARFNRLGGFRSLFTTTGRRTLDGPRLADAAYPDVLVAHAATDGRDLRLVLHPGNGGGRQTCRLAGLTPMGRYKISGGVAAELISDGSGGATLDVDLDARREVVIAPA